MSAVTVPQHSRPGRWSCMPPAARQDPCCAARPPEGRAAPPGRLAPAQPANSAPRAHLAWYRGVDGHDGALDVVRAVRHHTLDGSLSLNVTNPKPRCSRLLFLSAGRQSGGVEGGAGEPRARQHAAPRPGRCRRRPSQRAAEGRPRGRSAAGATRARARAGAAPGGGSVPAASWQLPTARQVHVQHEAEAHEMVLHVLLARVLVQLANEDAGACRVRGAGGG